MFAGMDHTPDVPDAARLVLLEDEAGARGVRVLKPLGPRLRGEG